MVSHCTISTYSQLCTGILHGQSAAVAAARTRAAARVSRGQCTVKRRHIYWAHGRAAPCCHDYDTTTSAHTAAAAIYGTADRPAQLPARPHGTHGVSDTEYKQLTPKDKCASALALQHTGTTVPNPRRHAHQSQYCCRSHLRHSGSPCLAAGGATPHTPRVRYRLPAADS